MSTAQVRRLYHHKQHGGELKLRDIGYCVEVCEGKDYEIQQLQQQNQEMLEMIQDSARLAGDAILARDPYIRDRLKGYISAAHALITKIEKGE